MPPWKSSVEVETKVCQKETLLMTNKEHGRAPAQGEDEHAQQYFFQSNEQE